MKIQNQSSGRLKVVLNGSDNKRSVYDINAQGGTVKLTLSNESIYSSISSASGRQMHSSSWTSSSSSQMVSQAVSSSQAVNSSFSEGG